MDYLDDVFRLSEDFSDFHEDPHHVLDTIVVFSLSVSSSSSLDDFLVDLQRIVLFTDGFIDLEQTIEKDYSIAAVIEFDEKGV